MEKETEGQAEAPETQPDGAADAAGPVEEQLKKAQEAAARMEDNWKRAAADLQNYKRRAEQERDESRRFSQASLIINLLPIVDDFERAFESLPAHLAGMTWFDGIRLIYRKLCAVLENSGVTPIQTDGEAFDPRFHEAVAHVEGEEGKVMSEVQRGYKLYDRVLRPAMVVVGKGGGEDSGQGTVDSGQEEES